MGQVSLRGIHKTYGEVPVINGVDLDVREGEFLVFVGPSGCGKSTMLRMIAGLESITSGELLIDGVRANDIRAADRGAAMVFQSYALYPHMTVAENMGFALKMAGVSKAEREEQVSRTAEALRISELLKRFPKELSGGQRQRVAIGRAIVRKPKVFLFDEPLSNLDAALRVDMRIELSRLHKELGTTMIYVTHDQVEAMTMGSRIAVFNQGRIEQLGSPMELYNKPATEFVAAFLGTPRINLVDRPDNTGSLSHRAFWQKLVPSESAGIARAGLRAEHVAIVTAAEGIPATVVLAEHLGDASVLHVRIDGLEDLIHAKTGADQAHLVAGDCVGLRPAAERAIYFDATGRRID
ncbi:MAG: sn-glycerol-3-phosphate ABC transporter ATP-binding protein UgpC [Betaproteobacteria bacterium]|nr:MAG: sn-glycerol-3-phosphate ABC transporter ATP-binding protein UgpC [Betaproteobacteria bacterium]